MSAGPLQTDAREFLEHLVRAWGPRIEAYARRMGSRADPEEVVAETFCRAAQNLAAIRARPRPELYLFAIARNLCRDAARRRRTTGDADAVERVACAEVPPGAALEQTEQRAALLAAIDALPEVEREIVVLRLSAALKFEEIAEVLHIPLGTALGRMHSAVKRLQGVMGVRV